MSSSNYGSSQADSEAQSAAEWESSSVQRSNSSRERQSNKRRRKTKSSRRQRAGMDDDSGSSTLSIAPQTSDSSSSGGSSTTNIHLCSESMCYGSREWHTHPHSIQSETLKFNEKTQSDFAKYHRWRDTIPMLYDDLTVYSIPEPSHSVHFVRNLHDDRLLLSSQTEDGSSIYLQSLLIHNPKKNRDSKREGKNDDHSHHKVIEQGSQVSSAFSVSKIRAMPQDPHLVATRANTSDIAVYSMNMDHHSSVDNENDNDNDDDSQLISVLVSPRIGYALSWSDRSPGLLLAGDVSGQIHEYQLDRNHDEVRSTVNYATRIGRQSEMSAVEFAPQSCNLFASANAEGLLCLWDRRMGESIRRCLAGFQDSSIFTLDWNAKCIGQLATGDSSGRVRLWDVRNLKKHQSEIHQHSSAVSQVRFCPYNGHLLASSSVDQLVCLYDCTLPANDRASCAPGKPLWASRLTPTVFVHPGHCAPVTEFDWAPNRRDLTIASSDLAGVIQVWTPIKGIHDYSDS